MALSFSVTACSRDGTGERSRAEDFENEVCGKLVFKESGGGCEPRLSLLRFGGVRSRDGAPALILECTLGAVVPEVNIFKSNFKI